MGTSIFNIIREVPQYGNVTTMGTSIFDITREVSQQGKVTTIILQFFLLILSVMGI